MQSSLIHTHKHFLSATFYRLPLPLRRQRLRPRRPRRRWRWRWRQNQDRNKFLTRFSLLAALSLICRSRYGQPPFGDADGCVNRSVNIDVDADNRYLRVSACLSVTGVYNWFGRCDWFISSLFLLVLLLLLLLLLRISNYCHRHYCDRLPFCTMVNCMLLIYY